ncbi:MAG: hypothetical protein HW387_1497 [Parachlamydiales bacterium]|nr:hypothetical protein [Parachlamydiales bacterium]
MSLQSFPLPAVVGGYRPIHSTSFREELIGENAFYNQPDYFESTQRDLTANKSLPVAYTWNTEYKIVRIVKQILTIIIFPIGIYKLLHILAGKLALLPASSPTFLIGYPENHANDSRSSIPLEGDWKYKRITVEVDGYKVDAMIVGKASTLNNGRWVLSSNGNGEFYEDELSYSRDFKQILIEIKGNAIVFNYPGVGASSGLPNRQAMAKAYRAMLSFLEDQNNGIGAREIVGYGNSIGGGVQGDALKTHALKRDVKYVFVKSRTFSDLSTTASILTCRPLGFLVKLLGWNMDSTVSSKKLQAPEIIMQTARVQKYEELHESSKIIGDGVIPANASLAKALLDDATCPKRNKLFIGMSERHNDELGNPSFLAQRIETFLRLYPLHDLDDK